MADKKQQAEQREAHERTAPSGKVVYRAILEEGEGELERSTSALFWSGLAAGLSMGFSMIAEGLLNAHLAETLWRPLVSKFGYSAGFLIVILGRQQLFTENTLTPILPLLKEKKASTLLNVLRLWVVVFVANMLGALAIAYVTARTEAFEPGVRNEFIKLGQQALEGNFGTILLKGIFAGWLIALMVWLLPFAETARVWVIILITYLVGLGHFSHIIAGAVETFAAAASGAETWSDVLARFVAPALIGNIIGGVLLVATLNHAQIVAGGGGEDI